MKNAILKGTFILTITGLLTRILGFFYRIYLADAIGAEMLGIYQLIFPVYGICYTIYASGIQTAVSKLVAEATMQQNYRRTLHILGLALGSSFSLACILAALVYTNCDFIAGSLLMEPRTASSLKLLALTFPFCSITACINGYYYGHKKTIIPATTQLLEQIVRMVAVFLFSSFLVGNTGFTCELAVIGLLIGEMISCFYNVCSLPVSIKKSGSKKTTAESLTKNFTTNSTKYAIKKQLHTSASFTQNYQPTSKTPIIKHLFSLALPLSANRLIINILHSFESVLVPYLLKISGLSDAESLRLFGILNGMVLPFILFPSTLTNSLSVLLLPAISEANAAGNTTVLRKTSALSIKYSLLIGIFSSSFFLYFGMPLGTLFFHETLAGSYLRVLSFLCPFLYVSTTLVSIINGLGKAHLTFYTSVCSMVIRILVLLLLVPQTGLYGYLLALLISQLFITLCDSGIVWHFIKNFPSALHTIVLPALAAFLLGFFFSAFYERLLLTNATPILLLSLVSLLFCFCYLAFLLASKIIGKQDFH